MSHQLIAVQPDKTPTPLPYTPAIKVGGFVYCSGAIGMDENGQVVADFEAQVRLTLERIRFVLKEAGSSMSHVVKATVFLTDMKNFDVMNGIYKTYFSQPFPARTCVAVSALPKGAQVEIEVVAVQANI
uniref:Uncharacterized protein n=1 Tax=Arcella intermedia TaxID=1963864 RepID=A0A6B2LS04_9EUKA|eukprot:TRINITY_DN321_c0_g1_i1.p1 TRINITY_DN321_c0_g1~~TRINITY_DN321_c0_g1_i1.p1  ORF type:complete len:138 (+),score=25.37 TRINITY_DN321_c0_g1_i1:30-416(+)